MENRSLEDVQYFPSENEGFSIIILVDQMVACIHHFQHQTTGYHNLAGPVIYVVKNDQKCKKYA